MSKRALDRLSQILEIERTALLAGDLGALEALGPEKEAIAATFDESDGRELQSISGALARNGALLAAARDGVTTVLSTLQNQRTARSTLSSYDSSGKATTISKTPHGTERRF